MRLGGSRTCGDDARRRHQGYGCTKAIQDCAVSELIPNLAVIGLLTNPKGRDSDSGTKDAQAAARTLGKDLIVLNASAEPDFNTAFAALAQRGAGAVMFASDPIFQSQRHQIIELAARHAIPAIYSTREFAVSGGLMSYGDNFPDAYRLAGVYTGRILKGAKPADLPVVQPSKFELVVNLQTAKALGLNVPLLLQQRADEVIE